MAQPNSIVSAHGVTTDESICPVCGGPKEVVDVTCDRCWAEYCECRMTPADGAVAEDAHASDRPKP